MSVSTVKKWNGHSNLKFGRYSAPKEIVTNAEQISRLRSLRIESLENESANVEPDKPHEGRCQCGCGRFTRPMKKYEEGYQPGKFRKWLSGHKSAMERMHRIESNPGYNSGLDIHKQYGRPSHSLLQKLQSWRPLSFEERHQKIDSIIKHGLNKINERTWADRSPREKTLLRRPRQKPSAPYERREINYEKQTELPLLTCSQGRFLSLDESRGDTGRTLHESVPGKVNFVYPNDDEPNQYNDSWLRLFLFGLPRKLQASVHNLIQGEPIAKDTLTEIRALALKYWLNDSDIGSFNSTEEPDKI